MFRSFFPEPKLFFGSAVIWTIVAIAGWFTIGPALQSVISLGTVLGVVPSEADPTPFFSADKVWLYQYILMAGYLFCVPWYFLTDNRRWYWWSVVGTVTIIEVVYFDVQISAWMNDWYGGFYNLIQQALTTPGSVSLDTLSAELFTVMYVLLPRIALLVLNLFFVQHYLFRWRRAMSFYYLTHWPKVREVEGASQRIQEDTQRFSSIVESLGVSLVGSVMTLIVFLPLLWDLSSHITALPVVGPVAGSLVWVALFSATFGTALLALVGIKLPGLEFQNQRVEAAFRKELVYGEDHPDRGRPLAVRDLFIGVQTNYFRLYAHYLYFNVARFLYLQLSNFVPVIAMAPTIAAGAITLGIYQQVSNAFSQVEDSLRFLANSWTTIISLISVYKRLRTFESNIPPDAISGVDYDDPRYLRTEALFPTPATSAPEVDPTARGAIDPPTR